VRPTVRFETEQLADGLRITARELDTNHEGPGFFMRLMDTLVPEFRARTEIRAEDGITYSHTLKIEFPLPFWWPVPDAIMSRVGRQVLEASTRKDVDSSASKLRERYEEWKREQTSAPALREVQDSTSSK
jgi:hypothetical protein